MNPTCRTAPCRTTHFRQIGLKERHQGRADRRGSAAGAAGLVFADKADQKCGEKLMDALNYGRLLLWVRTPDAAREEKARSILVKHGGRDVHVHDLKMPHGERGPLTQFVQKSTERV